MHRHELHLHRALTWAALIQITSALTGSEIQVQPGFGIPAPFSFNVDNGQTFVVVVSEAGTRLWVSQPMSGLMRRRAEIGAR